jgi:hypothetical protein
LNWSATSGGAGGSTVPGTADDVFFDANSGAVTVTIGVGYNPSISKLTMTGFTGVMAYGSQNISVGGTGTVYLGATTFSVTGTPVINCTNSGATSRTINPTGTTEANSITINVTAGTGTVTMSTTAAVKSLNYTGFSGTGGLPGFIHGDLTIPNTMTVTASGVTLIFSATSGTQLVTTNGVTIDKPIRVAAPNAVVQFQDAFTQGSTRSFTFANGTVQLKSGVTSTVGSFATTGTTQKFLQSALAGSQATLSQASGTVSASYLTIQDINATGGAIWNALYENQNVDAGDNTGWNFGGSPQVVSEVTYRIRSFTTPRRF